MRFSFTDDQLDMADALSALLAGEFPLSTLRQLSDAGIGHAADLWSRLGQMGVLAVLVPEEAGGMGGTMVDAILLFQRLGRAAVPGPVIEHMVAAPLLHPEFPGVLDGSTVATTWLDRAPFVAHADVADVILADDGVHTSFVVTPHESLDRGRQLASVAVEASRPLHVERGVGDRLALAAAAYLIGLGETMIDIAGDYARQREQFGKPIGAFQAVKHLLADALLKVEFAKAPTYRAAWSEATGQPGAGRDVSMAKSLAGDAAYRASRASMQVHGGIGYTWEADLQLLMKKAWALQRAFGDSRWHRRRVADAVLGPR